MIGRLESDGECVCWCICVCLFLFNVWLCTVAVVEADMFIFFEVTNEDYCWEAELLLMIAFALCIESSGICSAYYKVLVMMRSFNVKRHIANSTSQLFFSTYWLSSFIFRLKYYLQLSTFWRDLMYGRLWGFDRRFRHQVQPWMIFLLRSCRDFQTNSSLWQQRLMNIVEITPAAFFLAAKATVLTVWSWALSRSKCGSPLFANIDCLILSIFVINSNRL